ncbi:uncharacterized protein EAF02_001899 [Botrytis sinoallii]|uniref:uncharacterized protein n=1 Tax=Botrytis sinoallii TaxID=1463999 RepID=UPI0019005690|nr:uncharacterized protein EAF02_001899 [Botrytis sinoallii]KAF7889484.1 hypothetical protein EAF02_001899 [Botrytis sinoallii]
MPSPSLDKDTSGPKTPQSSLEDGVELMVRGTFKEYVERTFGERYILEHPDLVSLFEPSNPRESSISVISPALELLELAFASLTEAEVQSTDIKSALHTKFFFDETFSIPSSLENTSVKALVLVIKAISNDGLPVERKEPREFINFSEPVRNHLIYKCSSPNNCTGNTLECIIDSEGPSVIQRPTEDSPDYLPHHSTTSSDFKIDFVHPCHEYTELSDLLHGTNQTDRLSHHNGVLLVPENRTPNYYKYVKKLIENKNHGIIATYMGCCKHNPRLWTKINDETMSEEKHKFNCRVCSHSCALLDGRICTHCSKEKVLQKLDCKKEYGVPLTSYIRHCSPQGPSEDILRHYYLDKDEDGVVQELVNYSISDIVADALQKSI